MHTAVRQSERERARMNSVAVKNYPSGDSICSNERARTKTACPIRLSIQFEQRFCAVRAFAQTETQ